MNKEKKVAVKKVVEKKTTAVKEKAPVKKVAAKKTASPAKEKKEKVVLEKVLTEKKAAVKRVTKAKITVIDKQAKDTFSLLTELDIYLFKEGKHFKLYEKLGAHLVENNGVKGCYFAVWAPNASSIGVIGNFNEWQRDANNMVSRADSSGIWEIFIPAVAHGELYKYSIENEQTGAIFEKFDPFAMFSEVPPHTSSVVWDINKTWDDKVWMQARKAINLQSPISIYELHFGSWRRVPEENNRPLTYREMAKWLVPYIKETGFTHVEFLPLNEHPFFGSWGYQTVGYFAPTSRYGSPQDLMFLIDELHQNNIGVILDWVPSHFPADAYALDRYDGTHLYEHADPRKGFHPDWKSNIFNYGRFEVRSFLISSALFWLDKYHVDGLRVDAVASMLYLDYSRNAGEWEPNENGGNENLEAVSFLKELNQTIYTQFPDVHTIAEESTAWPMVSRPVAMGGLGFGMKWMMGWMHDSLEYFKKDPIYREFHQSQITFSIYYAFNENFMLPLSHDEVVHGKGSLINKMPGDQWQKFANLRLLYTYMYMHPGAKLLFMGQEFAQYDEWNHEKSLDWSLLESEANNGIKKLISDLNLFYKNNKELHELNFNKEGFEWVDIQDAHNSVISFLRKDNDGNELLIVGNFTPVLRNNYKIGVNQHKHYKIIFNSDSFYYGGSNSSAQTIVNAEIGEKHNRPYHISLNLPPLGMLVLKVI